MGFGLVKKVLRPEKLSQIILGGQDGLVNTFGVILGVAAASSNVKIIIAGGLAACFAESISMGAVSYTSQRAAHDHYESELAKVAAEVDHNPKAMRERVVKVYREKGFSGKELEKIVSAVTSNRQAWVSALMSEERKISPIRASEVNANAIIVFVSALLGSLVPLVPFLFFELKESIILSFVLSSLTLFLFGFYKGRITVGRPFRNGLELLIIGLSAALLGYGIGYLFGVYV